MRRLTSLLLVVGMVVLWAISASAATIHVPADQPTIQLAVEIAGAGDTVLVADGTYFDPIDLTGTNVVIEAEHAGRAFLGLSSPLYVHDVSTVSLHGFTFVSGNPNAALVAYGTYTLTVSECRFLDFNAEACITLSGVTTQTTIENCVFSLQQTSAAISTYNTTRVDIINCTIDGGARGIRCGSDVLNTVRNCILTNLTQTALEYTSGGGFTGSYNNFWGNYSNYSNMSPGIGDKSIDPEFVFAPMNCYELQPSSGCIDAGDPNPLYNDPNGTRNDLGSFPFSADSLPPSIIQVRDVPADQGGRVSISWQRAKYDYLQRGGIEEYSVWRSLPFGMSAAGYSSNQQVSSVDAPDANGNRRTISTSLGTFQWERIGSVPGHYFEQYSFTAETLFDSTGTSDGKHHFLISAHSPDGVHFYDSEPDSGYSVDNLAPPVTQLTSLATSASGAILNWVRSTVPDAARYRLYRDTSPIFTPSTALLFAELGDTVVSDPSIVAGTIYYYRVAVVDYGGNEGALSNELSGSYCDCSCHADPACNGSTDVVDVVHVINRAFRGMDATFDDSCTPHGLSVDGRTDVDCSGATDVIDVVKAVNVAFRNANAAMEYCEPCP